MLRLALAAALACLAAGLPVQSALAATAADHSAWARQAVPAPGSAEVVGRHALGCIGGAQALPAEGAGYQVLRLNRNRYWGHPSLVRFITAFAARVDAAGLGIALIGDLAQPRGGPMAYGHSSHQTGLDADVWFRLVRDRLPPDAREAPKGLSMVGAGGQVSPDWGVGPARMLEIAASFPEVDRIFVNAAIKRAVCQAYPGERPAWLTKLRPWWGHDEHFHVRLHCPADSPDCEPAAALPPGDGCDEADSWLDAEARAAGRTAAATPPKKPAKPPLPAKCDGVLRR